MPIEFDADTDAGRPAPSQKKASFLNAEIKLFSERPGAQDRILFTERLALQLETGNTLHGALQSLLRQEGKAGMKTVIGDLIDTVVSGGKFSDALRKHPTLFPSTYANLVAVSEAGGFMAEVLDQLRETDEKQEKLRAAITSAFSYPAFLVVFSIAVVIFVLLVVFPKFTDIFNGMYARLPASTKLLMATSELLLTHPVAVLLCGAGIMALGLAGLKQPATVQWLDRKKLEVPLLRDIFVRIYLTRLMRTMGISLQHGVTILATLAACREVVSNAAFQQFIARLEKEVTEGKGIANGFGDTDFIPPTVLQMIITGEQTGRLGQVMTRIADFYDRELTKKLEQMAKLAEPLMLVVMGCVVGLIVSSLVLPIFKMSQAMH